MLVLDFKSEGSGRLSLELSKKCLKKAPFDRSLVCIIILIDKCIYSQRIQCIPACSHLKTFTSLAFYQTQFPNTEKRDENLTMTCSGVFLMNFSVENVVKHFL